MTVATAAHVHCRKWIEPRVPAIVDEETFNAIHALRQGRIPKRGAPRVVNGEKLRNGQPDRAQAYARVVLREVSVKDKDIRISGSKAVLARTASSGLDKAAPAVLSIVRKWRTVEDKSANTFVIEAAR